MGRTSQVRLEPDVVGHLDGDHDLDGLSLSAAANRALRRLYETPPPSTQDRPEIDSASIDARPASRRPPVTRRALAARGGGTVRGTPGRCPNHGARMIGNRCAACGSTVR